MRIRVLTYNIHKGIGGIDRRYRPERIAEVIAHHDPDLVFLQEVDNEVRRSSRHRQVDLLGDMLGLAHRAFFPNVAVRGGGEYGNAILTRHRIAEATKLDLTIPLKKKRGAVHARILVEIGAHVRTIHAWDLHLGLSGFERKIQLRRFLESHPFSHLHHDTPQVLAGDFNDVYGTLGPKLLQPAGFRTGKTLFSTFPAWAPLRALDSIYVRGAVEILHYGRSHYALARQASDHLPLVADLRLPEPPKSEESLGRERRSTGRFAVPAKPETASQG